MNTSIGLSESVAGVVQGAGKCEQCGATIRLGEGSCVSCILKEGLGREGEASAEVFESVLEEANVPDTQWRLGNYEILEEIGRGGMGVIYRARQRYSRRFVALKRVLTYHADSRETLARFRREAEAAASLDHPNILPIHEVGETEDGLPFFSMKLATGGSLRTVASALRGKARECVQLMAKVARAAEYAHGQGLLHRDLQPGNILLDARGEPMVSDFGLAKWLDEESDLTQTLTTFGTPGYIAPEQAEGAAFSPAADIYSLGAILFSLLAGRPPFVGANALSVIRQAAATPAPKLRAFAPSVGRDLETIVARCLERDPKARYQTAGALAEDLERWLEGRPIIARPVRAPARVWRWSRRNPVLAGGAVFCFLLIGSVVWLLREHFAASPPAPPEKSIAVLPFENLSNDKQGSYFADGIQDEILTSLARVADLKVISRTSVMQYKSGVARNLREVGQQLGVANVVEGSVQRSGNRVRVNAQLLDARSDRHLWGQTYDRDLSDVFAIQSEIAKAIADQLQAKLSPAEQNAIERPPTSDLSAFDLYTRAKNLLLTVLLTGRRTDFLDAADLLNQAIARDPSFLQAYCQLAWVHDALYFFGFDHTPARLALAEAAIQAAFRLRPDAGEAHLAQAWNLYWGHLDYD
jgi:TolB-like protein/tRNA A-37 threonylcarbamoyl transferase component Bud32